MAYLVRLPGPKGEPIADGEIERLCNYYEAFWVPFKVAFS
jgi:hypothetical protein